MEKEKKVISQKTLIIILAVVAALFLASAIYFAWSFYTVKSNSAKTIRVEDEKVMNQENADETESLTEEENGSSDYVAKVVDGDEVVLEDKNIDLDEEQSGRDSETLSWQTYTENKFMNFSISFPAAIIGGVNAISSGPRSEEERFWTLCEANNCTQYSMSKSIGFRVLKLDDDMDLDSLVESLESRGYDSKNMMTVAGQQAIKVLKTRGDATVTDYYIEKDGYVLNIWKSLVDDEFLQKAINSLTFN